MEATFGLPPWYTPLMGSIQNKRGGARGAPPDTYIPFLPASPETPDILAATRRYIIGVIAFILLFIVLGVIYMLTGPWNEEHKPSWPGPFHDCGK